MPLGMQAKLLRALETRMVRPVGSDVEVPLTPVSSRPPTGISKPTWKMGVFGATLYFRINVIRIDVPPLRARGSDILLLAQHFTEKLARRLGKAVTGISAPAAERLLAYPWPGNVRELQNAIERAVALTQYEKLVVEDLPEPIRSHRRSQVLPSGDDPSEMLSMHEVENDTSCGCWRLRAATRRWLRKSWDSTGRTMYRKLASFADSKKSL